MAKRNVKFRKSHATIYASALAEKMGWKPDSNGNLTHATIPGVLAFDSTEWYYRPDRNGYGWSGDDVVHGPQDGRSIVQFLKQLQKRRANNPMKKRSMKKFSRAKIAQAKKFKKLRGKLLKKMKAVEARLAKLTY